MESVVAKPTKPPSSNVSEIVYKFAKVCKLRSVGVFSNENVRSDSTEDDEYQKIHPQPIQELENPSKLKEDELILKLFHTVSALKLSYIHLQQAHFPYNPQKIESADDLVVSKLKTLGDIKKSYKNSIKPKLHSGPLLPDLIRDRANQLEKLRSQIQAKDNEIGRLKLEVEDLEHQTVQLEKKIKQEENARFSKVGTLNLFLDVFEAASKSIHDFAKPLISLMKASGWNLDAATNSIENSIVYSERSHKKFAFEAYISRRMFYGFNCLSLDVEDVEKYYGDTLDLLIKEPDSNFAKFCKEKYVLVVHPTMEASFFGNLDHRRLVKQGKHPRTMFYQVFVKMAKWVWLLRVIGSKIDPKAEMFGVRRGSEFSNVYMENVVEDECYERVSVGFMVMPGFKVGCNAVRSKVYVSRMDA